MFLFKAGRHFGSICLLLPQYVDEAIGALTENQTIWRKAYLKTHTIDASWFEFTSEAGSERVEGSQ